MKVLIKLFIALLVVVAIAVAGAVFYVDSIAKKAIEQGGEMALGVPTHLDKAQISLFGGEAALHGLRVSNPASFTARTFMELGQGAVAVSLGSLFGDTVTIPKVTLTHIRVNLEQQGKKNNIDPILRRARTMSGSKGSPAPQSQAGSDSGSGKKFIIDYFLLDDVQLDAKLDVLGQISSVKLVLPKIELRNLGGKEQGLPMPELIQQVVQAVLSAAQQSSGQLSPALAALLAGELGDLDGVKAQVIGEAKAQVEKKVKELQQQMEQQLPADLPPEVNDVGGKQSGDLLKGVGSLLGGSKK